MDPYLTNYDYERRQSAPALQTLTTSYSAYSYSYAEPPTPTDLFSAGLYSAFSYGSTEAYLQPYQGYDPTPSFYDTSDNPYINDVAIVSPRPGLPPAQTLSLQTLEACLCDLPAAVSTAARRKSIAATNDDM